MKSKVLFTNDISPNGLIRIFEALNIKLHPNVAVKISTGNPVGIITLNPSLLVR